MSSPAQAQTANEELRDLAVAIATETAALARTMRAEGVRVADRKSSAVDVVTAADRACEEFVRDQLARLRPDDAVMGEEGADTPGTSGLRWIVDPIDGTVNYLYGLAECAVSLAVERDGEVLGAAVVSIPAATVWAAAKGCGATRDGEPISVRGPAPVAERLVLTGFGYRSDVRAHQGACVARMLPLVRDIRRMGSCALDLCHVAEGSADAYVEEGPQPWDHAAASLVLTEAGGRFALLDGSFAARSDGASPSLVVGAAEHGFETFVELLDECGFTA